MTPLVLAEWPFILIALLFIPSFGLTASIACSNKEAADIVFALDSSFSIRKDDFKRQLGFIQAIVDQLEYGPNDYQVGVISFESDVILEIRLDQYKKKWDLRKAINKIKHMKNGTNTREALHFARTQMFTEAYGARSQAKKQLVIITDGLSENTTATVSEAAVARSVGIEIFSIAVGTGPAEDFEIHSIASKPKAYHVFKVGEFKALASIVDSVSSAACDQLLGDGPSALTKETVLPGKPDTEKAMRAYN
ncbi:collagen alpha-1(xii) chain [Plakobranchus ocellatus]|uniref:Collagen alpha-1(Xii) chain n=1 Tax=Plakobranchus ocellatus TaxID=259542 RepID=A0AAV4E042_9GAST|nr:collagen alpha-1(xii) chain [Plakobranchus ocellatus]